MSIQADDFDISSSKTSSRRSLACAASVAEQRTFALAPTNLRAPRMRKTETLATQARRPQRTIIP